MDTDIEKLVDLMIQERMQGQFAKWREAETGKEKKEYKVIIKNVQKVWNKNVQML